MPMRRRANVAGEERAPVNEELNRSVAKLEGIHEQLEKIDSEITGKVLEVEQNYKIRKEVYLRRNEIIKSISHFWLTMFENHPDLGTLITEQDEEILKYMVSLDVEDFKGVRSGYTITFNFSSNPYFEDTKLTKTYSISNDGTISKTSIPIKWKEGTDSANVSAHERIGAKRPFAEDSFIRWFIEETLTHGATDAVCETIREDIWPDPLKYFREFMRRNSIRMVMLRCILEECYASFSRTALVISELLNECLGLPPNFLRECNRERNRDFMLALRYFPASGDGENIGLEPHQDGSCFTLLFQDDVGGLQVLRDGDWIPIEPIEGTIIVNIGEVIQVLTNNKFKGPKHRVVRKEKDRYSFSFFYTMDGNQCVEPLPQFTREINEHPHYQGFLYKEYLQKRMKSRTHPPSRKKPAISISHYAVT